MTLVKIGQRPSESQILWLEKNIGPRTHWIKNSVGGHGWRAIEGTNPKREWFITFDNDAHASWFTLVWK